jgi:hypothetical protein
LIPLVTLLAALLVDAGQRTEGRLHELRGRAGVRDTGPELSPVQKRLLWLFRSFPPEVSIRAAGVFQAVIGGQNPTELQAPMYEMMRDLAYLRVQRNGLVPDDYPSLVEQESERVRPADYVAELTANVHRHNSLYEWGGAQLPATQPAADMLPWVAKLLLETYRDGHQRYAPYADIPPHKPSAYDAMMVGAATKIARALPRISDWAHATHPDLMQLTLGQAKHRSDRWHAQLEAKEKAAGVLQGEVVYRFADGWTVQNLTTKKHLDSEGDYQAHCVGRAGYWDQVQQGTTEIRSLRDPDGKPVITFEIQKRRPVMYWDVGGFQSRKVWASVSPSSSEWNWEIHPTLVRDERPADVRSRTGWREVAIVMRRSPVRPVRGGGGDALLAPWERMIDPPETGWAWDDPRLMTLEEAKQWVLRWVAENDDPPRDVIRQAKGFKDRTPGNPARTGPAARRRPVPGELEHVVEYVLHLNPDLVMSDPAGVLWYVTKHGFWDANPDAMETRFLFGENTFHREWGDEIERFAEGSGISGLSYRHASIYERVGFDLDNNNAARAAIVALLRERNGIPEDPRDWEDALSPEMVDLMNSCLYPDDDEDDYEEDDSDFRDAMGDEEDG